MAFSYPSRVFDLVTPALLLDKTALEGNLATMAAALPGPRLRPHVKAHKCTHLARRQREMGHPGLTAATIRECEVLARVGLGQDVLLANEVLDTRRLGALVDGGARITVAVDSEATIAAAAGGGVREVVVDVQVGLPRCGCRPEDAGKLADIARGRGLTVRGVMGYEGHLMAYQPAAERARLVEESMRSLLAAHADVGGDLVSAGGTGTYQDNTYATEIQAGSYALMDSQYGSLGLPFSQALFVLGRVISVWSGTATMPPYAVADVGLKALGMDHGNPTIEGASVWFCSDEHITFAAERPVSVGDLVRVIPAHCDPTVALHERIWLVDGEQVVDEWPVDLRGW
jgi:D-serine deaminase-like pyridoxal phosphate-dependent protein